MQFRRIIQNAHKGYPAPVGRLAILNASLSIMVQCQLNITPNHDAFLLESCPEFRVQLAPPPPLLHSWLCNKSSTIKAYTSGA